MSDEQSDQLAAGSDEFGLSAVRELLRLINQTDIAEILIERGDTRLHIKRSTPMMPTPMAMNIPAAAPMLPGTPAAPVAASSAVQPFVIPPPAPSGPPASLPAGHTITAPMVGTFYSSPSPKDRAFVSEGETIQIGDAVGIIEAMKMMNEIESEYAGRVGRVLVKNGQPVEYGQPLMVIEPL